MRLAVTLLFSIAVTSCGSEPSSGDDAPASDPIALPFDGATRLYESAAELPACDDTLLNRLVYISSEAAFKVCSTGQWRAINLAGPKGEAGAKGDTGAAGTNGDTGAAGTNGTDNRVTAVYLCFGNLNSAIHAKHSVSVFSSGDVFAEASIDDQSAEYSASNIYKASAPGAKTGAISIVGDYLGTPTSGYWSFAMSEDRSSSEIIYHDAESTPVEISFSIDCYPGQDNAVDPRT